MGGREVARQEVAVGPDFMRGSQSNARQPTSGRHALDLDRFHPKPQFATIHSLSMEPKRVDSTSPLLLI